MCGSTITKAAEAAILPAGEAAQAKQFEELKKAADRIGGKVFHEYGKAQDNKKGAATVEAWNTLDDLVFAVRFSTSEAEAKDAVFDRVQRYIEGFRS